MGSAKALYDVTKYCEAKGLEFNVKKAECVVTSKQKNVLTGILFRGQPITHREKLQYLAYTIASDDENDLQEIFVIKIKRVKCLLYWATTPL